MGSLILSLEIIIPLIVYMAIGIIIKRLGMVNDVSIKHINALIFKVFLPALLFYNVYKVNIVQIWNARVVFVSLGLVVAEFILLFFLVPLFEKTQNRRAVLVQGIMRTNYVLYGVPIIMQMYGNQAALVSITAATIVPLFNILTIFAFSYFSGEKANAKHIALNVLKNPLVIAAFLGLIFPYIGFEWQLFDDVLSKIAAIASPLGLIILGSSFNIKKSAELKKQLICTVSLRLIVVPLIGTIIAILFGLRNMELVIVYIMLAAPTAVASFALAQQMDGDYELAGQIVVYTSLFSIITIFLGTFVLSNFGFI